MLVAKVISLNRAFGLGVVWEMNPSLITAGIIGVGVTAGVSVIVGVNVIVGVTVMVAV